MKKINLLIIFVLAATMGFMTSCKNEILPVAAPIVTFVTTDMTIDAGADIAISGNIYAAGSIGTITYFKDGVEYGTPLTSGFDSDAATYFEAQFTAVTESFTFQVQVTDLQSTPKTTNSSTLNITVREPVLTSDVDAVQMYCATEDEYDQGTYASATTGENWNHAAAVSGGSAVIDLIDFWYYYSDVVKALRPIIMSPDKHPSGYTFHNGEILTGANATVFKVLSVDEALPFAVWSSVTDDSDIYPLMDGITDSEADYLEVGSVVAFMLEDGTIGVFKVTAIQGTYNYNDYIMIDVKVADGGAPVK